MGRALLALTSKAVAADQLERSAIIFSPHPDDEALGCGGTIIKKKSLGASVKLVHMTDGAAPTHADAVTRDELRAIRFKEAMSAGRVLGLSESEMYFLGFPDTRLEENIRAARERVEDILLNSRPEEVFVPHRGEPFGLATDHRMTTEIVRAALEHCKMSVSVWEYPIWFWLHWPWVGLSRNSPPAFPRWAAHRNSLRLLIGLRAFIDLRHSVHIGDVLERKRAAIGQHRSQMERVSRDPRWMTLADIAGGEFLDYFRQDREFFHRYEYRP